MARCADLVLCGVVVVVALALQGCGEVANESNHMVADTSPKNKQALDSAEKAEAELAEQKLVAAEKAEAEAKLKAEKAEAEPKVTPACATVCTSYLDGMTVESPSVCMFQNEFGSTCKNPAAATACMESEIRYLASPARKLEEKPPPFPVSPGEVTTPPPPTTTTAPRPVLCKPIAHAAQEKIAPQKLFLAGVLPEAVVTSFANFSMALVAVGFTLMAAMGVVVLRRHSQASAEPSLMDSDSEENLSDA